MNEVQDTNGIRGLNGCGTGTKGSEGIYGEMNPKSNNTPVLIVDRAMDVPNLVELDATTISVQWNPVPITVHYKEIRVVEYLMSFALQMQQIGRGDTLSDKDIKEENWSTQYAGPATYVQVKGLHPGRTYALRVSCEPVVTDPNVMVKVAPPSEPLIVKTKATCPSAILPPSLVLRQKTALKLKWSEPEEDGGHAVLEYVLEGTLPFEDSTIMPNSQGMYEIYRGPERSFLWKKLSPGVRYSVRVKAVNCVGEGAFSSIASFLTLPSVPGTPAQPNLVSCSCDSLMIEWPKVPGNGAEVTYSVEMAKDSGDFATVARVTEPMVMLTNLESGSQYRIRVLAENSEGYSDCSPLLVAKTTAPPPLPPSGLRSSLQDDAVAFFWEVLEDKAEGLIHVLEVCYNMPRASAWEEVYRGKASDCIVKGLCPGSQYLARSKCINKHGESFYSEAISFTTSGPREISPTGVHARQLSDTAAVTSEKSSGEDVRPCHVSGGENSIHKSDLTGVVDDDYSGTLSITSTAVSYEHIELVWSIVGNSEPKNAIFIVQISDSDDSSFETVYCGHDTQTTVRNLKAACSYIVRIGVQDESGGCGHWSEAHCIQTLNLPPQPPNLVIIPKGSRSIHLEWRDDVNLGSLSWEVEISHSEPGEKYRWTKCYQGLDSSFEMPNLSAGCRYLFRIRGTDVNGNGPWSDPVLFQMEAGVPDPPKSPSLSSKSGNIFKIAWNMPESNGSQVHEFELVASTSEDLCDAFTIYRGPDTTAKAANLEFGTTYFFAVRAHNSIGHSPWSGVVMGRTMLPPPSPPEEIKVCETERGIQIHWNSLHSGKGKEAECVGYELEISKRTRTRQISLQNSKSGKMHHKKDLVVLRRTLGVHDSLFDYAAAPGELEFLVRMRSIGGRNSGHGPWSEPEHIVMHERVSESESDCRSQDQEYSSDTSTGKEGTHREPHAGNVTSSKSRSIASLKVARSKPRNRRWKTIVIHHFGIREDQLIFSVLLCIALIVLIIAFIMN